MSSSDVLGGARAVDALEPPAGTVAVRPVRGATARFVRSELGMVFRRRRNLAMLAVLACGPLLLGVAIRVAGDDGDGGGPPFLSQITQNGLFLVFTGLVVALPLFMPLAVAVVSGEAVAGEASTGTLRYLLAVPVGRGRLLAVKYAGIAAYAAAAVATVAASGLLVAVALFPVGPVTLLSGQTVPIGEALVRILAVTAYVGVMLAGVGAIGLFVSTLTEVPIGAIAATTILTIVVQILDSVPQVSVIHPYLYSHWWLQFGDLLRSPVPTGDLTQGLLTQLAYVAVFGSLAWARFTTHDVTS